MSSHARLSPSNHRWVYCPGSVREESVYPDISGKAAIDGTGSHLLLELCIENDVPAIDYMGQRIGVGHEDEPFGWLVAADRCERVQQCLDYIDRRTTALTVEYPDCEINVEAESKSDPGASFNRDDWYGTCDVTITAVKSGMPKFIEVIDYKDGRGWVSEKNNSQLQSYLIGKIPGITWSGVRYRMTIVQPKTNSPIRYEEIDGTEITAIRARLITAAIATDHPEAPLIPDDKEGKGYCTWCKHKPNCQALKQKKADNIMSATTDVTTTEGTSLFELINGVVDDVKSLSNDKLSEIADVRAAMNEIFDSVEKEIESRIELGQDVPGYEMRPGKATRQWNESNEEMEKILRNRKLKKSDCYRQTFISPAQFEKLPGLTKEQKQRVIDSYVTSVCKTTKLTKVARKKSQSFEELFPPQPLSFL